MFSTAVCFAEKPPKAEELEDGYLIIGQYIVYRTKLTQDVYDGARLTMSDSQKIYYKSEYAKGTWFRIDESDQLAHILMGGSGNSVTTDRLNSFTYTLQIDKDGNVIKFDEGGNVQTFKAITDAIDIDIAQKKQGIEAALTDSDKELGKAVVSLTQTLEQAKKDLGLETYATKDDISTELAIAKDRLETAQGGGTGKGDGTSTGSDGGTGTGEDVSAGAIASAQAKVTALEELLKKQEELDSLKAKLKQATGDKVESINTEILDLQNTLNILNKSVGIDNTEALQEEALKSELLSAIDAGNVDLVKEIQKEMVQLNPNMADAAILTGVVDDLTKNKEDLEQMKLQAQKNGFDALLESLDTEIKSNSNKLEDALKDAKSVLNAKLKDKSLSDDKKDELTKALASVQATEESISADAVVPSADDGLKGLVAQIEKVVADDLEKALQKQILKGADITQLAKSDLKLANNSIKNALDANASKKATDLDQFLTEDILNNNLAFNREEIAKNSDKTKEQGLVSKANIVKLKEALVENMAKAQVDITKIKELDQIAKDDSTKSDKEKADIIAQSITEATTASDLLNNISAGSDKLNDEKAVLETAKTNILALIIDLNNIKNASDKAGNTELSQDIADELKVLDNLYNQLSRDEYMYMLELYKKRYYVLKDYTSDKAKDLEVSLSEYTTVIAGYDVEIEKIKESGIVDTDELYLEFEVWRYDIEKNPKSYKESISKLNEYRTTKKEELNSKLDAFSSKIDTLLNAVSKLIGFELSDEDKSTLMKIGNDIKKLKEVVKQIREE